MFYIEQMFIVRETSAEPKGKAPRELTEVYQIGTVKEERLDLSEIAFMVVEIVKICFIVSWPRPFPADQNTGVPAHYDLFRLQCAHRETATPLDLKIRRLSMQNLYSRIII